MTLEALMELISQGETLAVEFKSEQREPLSDRQLVEAVVCLANRPGNDSGWLLVGVEDDGTITGARPRHPGGKTDTQRVQALIANRTRPSLFCPVETVSVGDKFVLVIKVPVSAVPVGTAEGLYLRRAVGGKGKPECIPFHFHEMLSRQAALEKMDYSALLVPEGQWEDLDPLEFDRFRRYIEESRGQGDRALLNLSDMELAKVLGAIEGDDKAPGIRVMGLLLFGKEEALRRLIPTHEIAFQVLVGNRVEVNDFFRWPLLRSMDELLARFRARNREDELLVGMFRISVPDYSERAFREGVANAFVHRDYTQLGAVHIQWHADHLEISNPGGFPEGVRLDNLLVTPPRPRNPALADAFKRAGIVERTARGIDTIFYEQVRNGRPAPSYDRSTETSVVLVLPGGEANTRFVRLVAEENQKGHLMTLDELLLLNELWVEREVTTSEAARLIQKPEMEARSVLQRLVEQGLVESRGERKGRTYHLSALTYRRLGDSAAYVRVHGFDAIQQEAMILQYARVHNRVTRREASELCGLSPNQASRLLRRLAAQNKLRLYGKKRGAYYVLVRSENKR